MKTIYLCGPINKCTDEESYGWRELVESALAGSFRFLNPMRRDYRNREDKFVQEIVEGDYDDIQNSDIILAYANYASWGTAMEIHQAYAVDSKFVIAVCADSEVSPWLRYHSHEVLKSLDQAIDYLKKLGNDKIEQTVKSELRSCVAENSVVL